MAVLKDTVQSSNLLTAIGGTVTTGDDVIINLLGVLFDAGLDLTDGDTVRLDSLTFSQKFTGGTVDESAVNVDLSASGNELVSNHNGRDLRIAAGGSGAKIDIIKMIQSGIGEMFITTGDVGDIEQRGGRLNLNSTATISGTASVVDGVLELGPAASDAVTTLNVSGTGSVRLRRAATTINLSGRGLITLAQDSKAVGTVNVNGGTFRHEGDGNITTALVRNGGVLDLRNVSGDITITTLTTERGSVVLYPSSFTVTVTTHNKLANAEPFTQLP